MDKKSGMKEMDMLTSPVKQKAILFAALVLLLGIVPCAIYGATRGRMDIIRKADVSVVSRVGDEGISIPELERVIEVSFLFGSRMQESQRFGRLMHSESDETEHIILMTEEEFHKYQKRLYAITERGFRLEVMR